MFADHFGATRSKPPIHGDRVVEMTLTLFSAARTITMVRIVPEARRRGLISVGADAPRPTTGGVREEDLVRGAPTAEREPAPVGRPGRRSLDAGGGAPGGHDPRRGGRGGADVDDAECEAIPFASARDPVASRLPGPCLSRFQAQPNWSLSSPRVEESHPMHASRTDVLLERQVAPIRRPAGRRGLADSLIRWRLTIAESPRTRTSSVRRMPSSSLRMAKAFPPGAQNTSGMRA